MKFYRKNQGKKGSRLQFTLAPLLLSLLSKHGSNSTTCTVYTKLLHYPKTWSDGIADKHGGFHLLLYSFHLLCTFSGLFRGASSLFDKICTTVRLALMMVTLTRGVGEIPTPPRVKVSLILALFVVPNYIAAAVLACERKPEFPLIRVVIKHRITYYSVVFTGD